MRLARGAETVLLPAERPAAIRYTGAVPAGVLIPHIIFMFLAMLLATRAGLEVFRRQLAAASDDCRYIVFCGVHFMAETANILANRPYWTLATLFIGGMGLGPFVTHYAFGPWWTGFPVGSDITDSKTLIALVAWIAAAIAVGRSRIEKAWVVLAALVKAT